MVSHPLARAYTRLKWRGNELVPGTPGRRRPAAAPESGVPGLDKTLREPWNGRGEPRGARRYATRRRWVTGVRTGHGPSDQTLSTCMPGDAFKARGIDARGKAVEQRLRRNTGPPSDRLASCWIGGGVGARSTAPPVSPILPAWRRCRLLRGLSSPVHRWGAPGWLR